MYNCIFTAHCTEPFCDMSCPILAETSYLLERNGITMKNAVFQSSSEDIAQMVNVLKTLNEQAGSVLINPASDDTIKAADLLTYCAICQNWKGSNLHCTVYNLKFAKYLDVMKQSWSMKSEPEDLQYMRIWSESAKVLIISNFDYVNFKDFEAQTLLNLIQTRSAENLTTILVSPQVSALLHNNGTFINILISKYLNKTNNNVLEFRGSGGKQK